MVSASRAAVSKPMSSVAVPSQAGSHVALAVDSAGVVTLKPCRVVPWPVPVGSEAGFVDVEAASEEEIAAASVVVSIVAAEASEVVTADSADHRTRRADRVADMTVTAETTVEIAAVAAADTADVTTTEEAAAEADTVEVIDPAPEAMPCPSVKGTAETETGVETVAETEIETETDIVPATTTVTTRGNGHTKEDQATKANANCAATDDKTTARLVVGILSPLISLLSSSTSLASLTTRVSRQRQVFPHPGQPYSPCLKVKKTIDQARTTNMATLRAPHPDLLISHKRSVTASDVSPGADIQASISSHKAGGRHTARVRTGSISPCKMMCILVSASQSCGGEDWNSFRGKVRGKDCRSY